MVKSILAVALAVASLSRADVISYTISGSSTGSPFGRAVDFSSALEVPRFDPALGTFNSIQFGLWLGGTLNWNILSRDYWGIGFTDYAIATDVLFLDVTQSHYEQPVYGGGGIPCGTASFPGPCVNGWSGITDYPSIYYTGNITDQTSAVSSYQGWTTFVGALPVGLASFVGTSPIYLPVTVSVDGSRTSNNNGTSIGDLSGEQILRFGAEWKYNYTPTQQIQVTATPEPRWAWPILIFLAVGFILVHRRALPPVRPLR